MQYSIHEDNLPKLIEKLHRIENKCNKYGCTFSYAEVGEEFKNLQHYKEIEGAYGQRQLAKTFEKLERFVIIEVEGKAIINNWRFLATIEHTEAGNIIRSYSEIAIPDKYKTVSAHCDHCNIDRYRKDSYLILNTVTNEIKQVGKSCLQDYTSGLSAEMAASFASYFNTIAELNDHESLGGFTRHYIDVLDVLLMANEVVKKAGFVSKSKAEELYTMPTSEIVKELMFNPDSQLAHEKIQKYGINLKTIDNDKNKAEVNTMVEWAKSQSADNQYLNNLKVSVSNQYCEWRDIGILVSLPSAYFKAMEKEADRIAREAEKANQPKSNYVGKVGDKISLQAVTITHIAHYETQYGITHIFKIIDSNGAVYVWRTNKSHVENSKGEYPAIESFTNIKGTIKEHKEYNGEKQTELTRCKVF
jgi:hypothetical protein